MNDKIESSKTLVLRTSDAEGLSYNGFQWPLVAHGQLVACPDWKPEAICGNGLHGLLDGIGDYSLLSYDSDAIWQLVVVDRDKCVNLGGKVKFESCNLVYTGNMRGAIATVVSYRLALLSAEQHEGTTIIYDDKDPQQTVVSGGLKDTVALGARCHTTISGDKNRLVTMGEGGTFLAEGCGNDVVTSGIDVAGILAGDNNSVAMSGKFNSARVTGAMNRIASTGLKGDIRVSGCKNNITSSGYRSRLHTEGEENRIASSGGDSSLDTSGSNNRITLSGDYCDLDVAGDSCIVASVGARSNIDVLGKGNLVAALNNNSFVDVDEGSLAVCTGVGSSASAGVNGCIVFAWWDEVDKRYRVKTGYVGEDGIKPKVRYRLSKDNEFEEEEEK